MEPVPYHWNRFQIPNFLLSVKISVHLILQNVDKQQYQDTKNMKVIEIYNSYNYLNFFQFHLFFANK